MKATMGRSCGNPSILRSAVLAGLAPVASGTPEVESLTGYLQRLANAWSVPPAIVFERFLLPALRAKKNWKSRTSVLLQRHAALMNGCREVAQVSIRELSKLTGRRDLSACTWIRFAELGCFLSPQLLAPGMRWCFECWRSDGLPRHRYVRKLWTLSVVNICPYHGAPLIERCDACGRRQPFIARDVLVGVCASCGADLCEAKSIPPIHGLSHSSLEMFYARQAASLSTAMDMSDLMGFSPESLSAARIRGMAALKQRLLDSGEFASAVRSVEAWQQGTRRPSLEELFSVLWRAQWPILRFFPAELQEAAKNQRTSMLVAEDRQANCRSVRVVCRLGSNCQ